MRFSVRGKIEDVNVNLDVENGYYRVHCITCSGENGTNNEWYSNNRVFYYPMSSVIISHDITELPQPIRPNN